MNQKTIKLKNNSKTLKPKMSGAKIILWSKLRTKQTGDAQFLRQKTVGKYTVDFLCPKAKLIIELNSSQPFINSVKGKGKVKDDYFKSLGYKILKIQNKKVRRNIKNVIEEINSQIVKVGDVTGNNK